jgi:hypothetical protein
MKRAEFVGRSYEFGFETTHTADGTGDRNAARFLLTSVHTTLTGCASHFPNSSILDLVRQSANVCFLIPKLPEWALESWADVHQGALYPTTYKNTLLLATTQGTTGTGPTLNNTPRTALFDNAHMAPYRTTLGEKGTIMHRAT